MTSGLRQRCIKIIDERVQKMNEILSFIKLIKVYAWEKPFSTKIEGNLHSPDLLVYNCMQ